MSNFVRNRITILLPVSIMLLVVSFILDFGARSKIDEANRVRYRSFVLSDTLRQSSDDLTRMVRSYVATTDSRYKRYYQEILDIRNGIKPRPDELDAVYWDLVLGNDQQPVPASRKIALLDLMKQSGFTDKEVALLNKAKTASDELTATEYAAMALVEKKSLTDKEHLQAINMLHDAHYLNLKANIMRSIAGVQALVKSRTLSRLDEAEKYSRITRTLFTLFILTTAYLLWQLNLIRRKESAALAEHQIHLESMVAERTTDMEKAMMELSKNEARTRQILDDSPAAVAMVTEEGKLVFANPRVCELFGITSEQMKSRNFSEFWADPEDRKAYIKRIKQDGHAENYETALKRADGQRIWGLINARLIEMGGQWLVLGWIHDITEIKKMQEIISSEREQLQHILDISPVGVGFSVEGEFHFVNQKFLELVDAKIGTSAKNIYVHSEDRDKIIEMLKKDRHVDYYEVQMYSPQREVRDIYVSYIPIKYQGKDGVLCWLLDITERKSAERELKINEQRLELAISAGHFTPWEYSIKNNRIQTFTFYEQILGYDQGEMDDTMETWLAVMHPDDRQLIHDAFIDYQNSNNHEFRLNYRVYAKDQQERWIECVGTITDRDANGQAIKITGMQHDITEQKRSEEIIAEKISELEKFNRAAVGRELRMIELKKEINDLLSKSDEKEKYRIAE